MSIVLPEGVRQAIAESFAARKFIQVAYVDREGQPQLSNRGSVVVLGDGQLGLWARKRDAGMAADVAHNPKVTLLYTDLADAHVLYTFFGTARVDDGELAEQVWTTMPDRERQSDAERKGTAIVVDLTKVVAMSPHPEKNFVLP